MRRARKATLVIAFAALAVGAYSSITTDLSHFGETDWDFLLTMSFVLVVIPTAVVYGVPTAIDLWRRRQSRKAAIYSDLAQALASPPAPQNNAAHDPIADLGPLLPPQKPRQPLAPQVSGTLSPDAWKWWDDQKIEEYGFFSGWHTIYTICWRDRRLWRGRLEEAYLNLVGSVLELECPGCGRVIAKVHLPTGTEADLERSSWRFPKDRRIESLKALVHPSQLPPISDPKFALHLSGAPRMELLHKSKVIWSEEADYEHYERFDEIADILILKYGSRIKDLVPICGCEGYLCGDDGRHGLPAIDSVRRRIVENSRRIWSYSNPQLSNSKPSIESPEPPPAVPMTSRSDRKRWEALIERIERGNVDSDWVQLRTEKSKRDFRDLLKPLRQKEAARNAAEKVAQPKDSSVHAVVENCIADSQVPQTSAKPRTRHFDNEDLDLEDDSKATINDAASLENATNESFSLKSEVIQAEFSFPEPVPDQAEPPPTPQPQLEAKPKPADRNDTQSTPKRAEILGPNAAKLLRFKMAFMAGLQDRVAAKDPKYAWLDKPDDKDAIEKCANSVLCDIFKPNDTDWLSKNVVLCRAARLAGITTSRELRDLVKAEFPKIRSNYSKSTATTQVFIYREFEVHRSGADSYDVPALGISGLSYWEARRAVRQAIQKRQAAERAERDAKGKLDTP